MELILYWLRFATVLSIHWPMSLPQQFPPLSKIMWIVFSNPHVALFLLLLLHHHPKRHTLLHPVTIIFLQHRSHLNMFLFMTSLTNSVPITRHSIPGLSDTPHVNRTICFSVLSIHYSLLPTSRLHKL